MKFSVTSRPAYRPNVEFVERKGTGHPDTISDHLAEHLANRLAREYVKHTGRLQHFNVDKALLHAGAVKEIRFGGGTVAKRPKVIIAGKADFSHGWRPNRKAFGIELERELRRVLPNAPRGYFPVEVWLSESSVDLSSVMKGEIPLANDTSFAAVSLPRSPLEETVHAIEQHLNSDAFRSRVPSGRDIKVMGSRVNGNVTITVAVPMLAGKVKSEKAYRAAVSAVRRAVRAKAKRLLGSELAIDLRINQADSAGSPYLTLTGSSAEAGDDGQVGRGNRFGGLITPYRPMSLEATAGKNPAAHVGKTYHAVAYDVANGIIAEFGGEATVRILSSIGRPVTEPQAVHVETTVRPSKKAVAAIVDECLHDWAGVRDRLIAGEYELF